MQKYSKYSALLLRLQLYQWPHVPTVWTGIVWNTNNTINYFHNIVDDDR